MITTTRITTAFIFILLLAGVFNCYKTYKDIYGEEGYHYYIEPALNKPEEAVVLNLAMGDSPPRLKGELPPEIGKLINLKALLLSWTDISKLPPEIKYLTKLEILRLDGTKLKTIPPEIGTLVNLRTLSLSATGIEKLPKEISNMKKLRFLDLSATNIKKIPEELKSLKNLKSLFLPNTEIIRNNRRHLEILLPGCDITLIPYAH